MESEGNVEGEYHGQVEGSFNEDQGDGVSMARDGQGITGNLKTRTCSQ